MKICGISDLHGFLPVVEKSDVLCICGDIFPLNIQRNGRESYQWFKQTFLGWAEKLDVKHVILIGGNHDFFLQDFTRDSVKKLIADCGLGDKVHYLMDEALEIEGIKFYGTPWVTGPLGWAFYDPVVLNYSKIPDCDILLTHQPPKIEYLGCSFYGTGWERDFGSDRLRDAILGKDIKVALCGHVHSGRHGGLTYRGTEFYNVSIKDEDYKVTYDPTYFEYPAK